MINSSRNRCRLAENITIGQRISIVGKTGSGKTTLAGQLALCLNIRHIELDAIHWLPNWQERNPGEFVEMVTQQLDSKEQWIVDGNYNSAARPIVWQRAETVIWLDYPLWLVYWRLFRRTLTRLVTRQTLWNNNRETLRALWGKDSLIRYARHQHQRHRRNYPILLAQPEYQHLTLMRLTTPRATQRFLDHLQCVASANP